MDGTETRPRPSRDSDWWAHETRLRELEWQRIGARRESDERSELAFWVGVILGVLLAVAWDFGRAHRNGRRRSASLWEDEPADPVNHERVTSDDL